MTQTIVNLGTGGAVLNGRNGSTGGADSNDALFLDWPGDNSGNYVYLPGGAFADRMQVPDEAALDITGDMDLRVYCALDDWSLINQNIITKHGFGSQKSFRLITTTSGNLVLGWSADGTGENFAQTTTPPGFSPGQAKWVRVTLDVNNGASGRTVTFLASDDGVSWTTLQTIVQAGVTSIFSGSTAVQIGNNGSIQGTAGKFYRAQIFNGIEGTKVLDLDTSVITSGSATSFTALTGQTVTVARATSGRKTVAVVSPVWLFGADDFMQVADNTLLNFGASNSFTVIAVVRQWATPANFGRYLAKTHTGAGWQLLSNGTAIQPLSEIKDASLTTASGIGSTLSAGAVTPVGFLVNRTTQTLQTITGTSLSAVTSITSVGNLTNNVVLRIGRLSVDGSNQDFELVSVAVFRHALTATEIAQVNAYYQARLS